MNNHACMQCLSCAFMCMVSYTIVWISRKYQCRIVFAYRLFNACLNTTYENRNALVMNCCNGETSEVVAVIMNVSTSFTATILIYRQGSSARRKYCQPGKIRISLYKQRTVRERWVFAWKIFFNDAKNFYSFQRFLPLFFCFAPFSCILMLADALPLWKGITYNRRALALYIQFNFFFFGCSHAHLFNHRILNRITLFSSSVYERNFTQMQTFRADDFMLNDYIDCSLLQNRNLNCQQDYIWIKTIFFWIYCNNKYFGFHD